MIRNSIQRRKQYTKSNLGKQNDYDTNTRQHIHRLKYISL